MNDPLSSNHDGLRECRRKKRFIVVRPNPQRSLGCSDSTIYSLTSMSKTQKLAWEGKCRLKKNISKSEPYLKDLESSIMASNDIELRNSGSLRSKDGRIFEGARFLFSKLSTRIADDSILVPQESVSCEITDNADDFNAKIPTPVTLDCKGRIDKQDENLTEQYNGSKKETEVVKEKISSFKGLLERQQAFEEESSNGHVDVGSDVSHLLNPIIGIINGNPTNETTSENETNLYALSFIDNESRELRKPAAKITISCPSESVAGGNELQATKSENETMKNEKEKVYQSVMSVDGTSKLDGNTRWKATSFSYPCVHRGKEYNTKRKTVQGNNDETKCLISPKRTENIVKLEDEETSLSERENGNFSKLKNNGVELSAGSFEKQKNDDLLMDMLRGSLNSNYYRSPNIMDVTNKDSNNLLKTGNRLHSLSEPKLDTKCRENVSVTVSPQHDVKPVDITTDNKHDEHPGTSTSGDLSTKKRNRVKLALATSHAGIYVTGESQDDTTSSDSPMGWSFERCPSWIGKESNDSPFLSPYYQPSSNEEKDESPVISIQKRKVSPISLSCTKQKSNSSEKDSGASWSPHSKTSGFSVQDSGFEASGRHSTALLSPSFRKMTLPITSHPGISTSGEMYSSDEYFTYSCEGNMLSPTRSQESKRESRRRKVAIGSSRTGSNDFTLLSPTFKAQSYEEPDRKSRKISYPYRFSNSTEGDSGLETPHSAASRSPHLERNPISTQSSVSSRGHHERSSRFSIQSRLSSKSSMKSGGSSMRFSNPIESLKGSFLSFLSPKNFFGSRKSSEAGKSSSCGSKSSRKQLADFPDDEKILLVNVSGRKFKLHEYFTTVYPKTLLGNVSRNKYYDANKEEFFFDRDPDIFRHIWNFYYTGKLHFPKDECVSHFVDEISFFGVADEYLCTCCWEDEFEPAVEKLEKLRKEIEKKEEEKLAKTRKIPENASLREKIWLTTKDPVVSTQAKMFYFLSMLAIVVSTVASITETIPCSMTLKVCKENNQDVYFYIDSGCVAFFTIEYLLRLITAPKRLHFVRKFMSIVDLLAIVPYYCDILMRQIFGPSIAYGIGLLEILRILRIVRVFKLLKHSRRLQSLVNTFKSSTAELSLIVFIYLVLVTVFASVIYYAEMQDNPKYSSIPESMWYAVITTTTTGYGDIVPETIIGKLIGCACCLLGVLIVALPVPILQIR
ncbi:uncharacterized protein LOC116286221 [Actinia tenebrosa]|uniref:Uncharacterized protein LOC116286221 n=1 Tax=Actinia tenebrosa TaxID=6105 RepID=A0A6P8GZM1_ACTTE|nr:uncharacterized protein LOC116286221 [Actinia tenebrosa]